MIKKPSNRPTFSTRYPLCSQTLGRRTLDSRTLYSLVGFILMPSMAFLPAHAASAVKSGQRVLMIEMTPALCSMQPTRARMRQCLEG